MDTLELPTLLLLAVCQFALAAGGATILPCPSEAGQAEAQINVEKHSVSPIACA